MQHLFSPLTIRTLTIRNRVGVSPMCQYSSIDGFANDWHLQHIGSRASGGAGLIIMEATGVLPEGRITPACHGLWKEAHIDKLKHITDFSKEQGAAIGIQIGHAGRKASMAKPWEGGARLSAAEGGWKTWAPSAIPFAVDHEAPHEMTVDDIKKLLDAFVASAKLAVRAGFQIIELHGAHGYLLHEFMSPISNKRTDNYGGSEENRFRLFIEAAKAVKSAIPSDIILGARLSCIDWAEGGLKIADTVRLSAALKKEGVDFIDCSSGFVLPDEKIPFAPGFQVPFAEEIRKGANIVTAAVGGISEAQQADAIIREGKADMVFMARAMLRDPYWPVHAAQELGVEAGLVPPQYLRGYSANKFVGVKKAG
jgi:2,4-dienoyl-CoA reductase-like NADH-dependent reductase (Old Yellow Enzyme family)